MREKKNLVADQRSDPIRHENWTFSNEMEQTIQRMVKEFYYGIIKEREMEKKIIEKIPYFTDYDYKKRPFEDTTHPSHSDNIMDLFMGIMLKIQESVKNEKTVPSFDEIFKNFLPKAYKIFGDLKKAYIPADRDFRDPTESIAIQKKIDELLANDIRSIKANGELTTRNDKECSLIEKWGKPYYKNPIYQKILEITDLDDKTDDNIYDEAIELVRRAEKLIIAGYEGQVVNWADYDGAKRTWQYIYIKVEAVLSRDINYGLNLLKEKRESCEEICEEIDDINIKYSELENRYNELHRRFRKNAKVNEELTKKLTAVDDNTILRQKNIDEYGYEQPNKKDDDEEIRVKDILEAQMNSIIEERAEILNELKKICNLIKYILVKDKIKHFFLNERVQLAPRFDISSVEAARRQRMASDPDPKISHSAGKIDLTKLELLRGILRQSVELNEIEKNTECYFTKEDLNTLAKKNDVNLKQKNVIPQIMIANCRSAEDVYEVFRRLNTARRDYKKDVYNLPKSAEIAIVPLFESKATTSAKFIRKYLYQLWNIIFYRETGDDKEKTSKIFNKYFNEIFIAGSDLGKNHSTFFAMDVFDDICREVTIFNKINGVNIQMKLGAGGSLARQAGGWGKHDENTIIRGKYRDDHEFNEKQKQNEELQKEIRNERQFIRELREKYKNELGVGENPDNMFIQVTQGANKVFETFPLCSTITRQSGTQQLLFTIDPERLKKIIGRIQNQADKNRTRVEEFMEKVVYNSENELRQKIKKEFGLPDSFKRAAKKQEEFFYSVMGDVEKTKGDLAIILELCVKMFPQIIIRNRTLTRQKNGNLIEFLEKVIKKPGIDSRAIGINIVSHMFYSHALIGAGCMLEHAKEQKTLKEVVGKIQALEMLHLIKTQSQIINESFKKLEKYGKNELAKSLKYDWNKLTDPEIIAALQEAMWSQISATSFDLNRLEPEEKKRLLGDSIPQIRESLDPNFLNNNGFVDDRTEMAGEYYKKHSGKIDLILDFLTAGEEFLQEIDHNIANNCGGKNEDWIKEYKNKFENTLRKGEADSATPLLRLYNKVKNIKEEIANINTDEYSEFLMVILNAWDKAA